MSKKGMELSVNFLVVLILAIVVFAAGILVFYNLYGKVEKIAGDVDAQTEDLLRETMNSGDEVAIYPVASVTVPRKEHVQYSLGITNNLGTAAYFTVLVKYKNIPVVNDTFNEWAVYNPGRYYLQNNEQKFLPIRIYVPKNAPRGQYIFDAIVCYNVTHPDHANCTHPNNPLNSLNRYSTIDKMYVVVN